MASLFSSLLSRAADFSRHQSPLSQTRRRALYGSDANARGMAVEVQGFEELQQMFATLPATLLKKAIRRATREVAQIVRDVAYSKAPKKTSVLADSLRVKSATRLRRNFIGHVVIIDTKASKEVLKRSPGAQEAFYGQFIEFGWDDKPEGIPFMRPALYDNEKQMSAKTRERVLEHLRSLKAIDAKNCGKLWGQKLDQAAQKAMRKAWKQEREALSTAIIESDAAISSALAGE